MESKAGMRGLFLRFTDTDAMRGLDAAQFGAVIRAGMKYAQNGTEPDFSGDEGTRRAWERLKASADEDAERFKRKQAGRAASIQAYKEKRFGRSGIDD